MTNGMAKNTEEKIKQNSVDDGEDWNGEMVKTIYMGVRVCPSE